MGTTVVVLLSCLSSTQDFDGSGLKISTPAVVFPISVASRLQTFPATYFNFRSRTGLLGSVCDACIFPAH